MFELKRLEVLMESVGHFTQYNGSCIFDLLLREECIALAFVTAVRTVTRSRPLDSSARRNLEIAKTILDGAFPAKVAVFVSSNWNAELRAEIVEIACAEPSHF